MLKGEKEEENVDYLREQGVTACKRFKIKRDHETIKRNTLLLTFNTGNVPKSLKISTGLFLLTYMCQILCAASTARGLDILRTIALSIWDLFGWKS